MTTTNEEEEEEDEKANEEFCIIDVLKREGGVRGEEAEADNDEGEGSSETFNPVMTGAIKPFSPNEDSDADKGTAEAGGKEPVENDEERE